MSTPSTEPGTAPTTGHSQRAGMLQRFDLARAVIQRAGALALDYFGRIASLEVRSKGAHDMVSEADLNTELLIRAALAEAFPTDGFLGEETGLSALDADQGLWVVDPIDGTQPFLSGMPNWCVSIAWLWQGELQFGLVFDPSRHELFSGGLGLPATVNGRPIAPHAGTCLADGLFGMGVSARTPREFLMTGMERMLELNGMFFRNGSGALSLCYVASGRLLGHIESHIYSWDCLAGIAIIEAAGGQVSPFLVGDALLKGRPLVAGAAAVFPALSYLAGGPAPPTTVATPTR